jgi:hypothetical protein
MKKIFILTIFLALGLASFSQNNFTASQYSMGFGAGDMHDFIGKASFRGFTIDYRYMSQPAVGVGFDIGWNVFYEELPDDIYDYGDITVSGKQWRYSNHFPILAAVDYFFRPDAQLSGYTGLGIGTMYSLRNLDMGTYTFEWDAWHFALRPEIGLLFNLAPGVNFNVAGKYYYGFKAGDLPAQGYFTLNVGFAVVK